MLRAVIFGSALVAAAQTGTQAPSDSELRVYEQAKVQAKRDPEAQVRLALWCEAHGLEAERLKHLAMAVLADPKNATARGLMGLVAYQGRWQRPDAVSERVRSDAELAAALAEYNGKRDAVPNTADAHWKLAVWCLEKGLRAEATTHFTTVTRLDPSREAAWKHLGCKKHNGRWMTEAQIGAENAEAEAQKKADRHWNPLLLKWKEWLTLKDRRARAETHLSSVTDPRAIPSVWRVLGTGSADDQAYAVQVLGQIDTAPSSRALAFLAVAGKSPDVRRNATQTLVRRDPRDFLGLMIGCLRNPLKYEVRPVGGPGTQGVLFVEGERFNVRRVYSPPPLPEDSLRLLQQRSANVFVPIDRQEEGILMSRGLGGINGGYSVDPGAAQILNQMLSNPNNAPQIVANPAERPGSAPRGGSQTQTGLTTLTPAPIDVANARRDRILERNIAEAQKAAIVAEQQLENDVASIEAFNANVHQVNTQVVQVLNTLTGQDLGESREAWTAWWTDQRGYAYQPPPGQPKPTFDQLAPLAYTPSFTRAIYHSCFGAGTFVRTLDGSRPIETLKAGDQILTQNTQTGALSFQPILAVFHNKPAPTVRVRFEGEAIVATGIHRFWRAGKGWAMARDLKPGDAIRTLGGVARVVEVESGSVQPVFNLEVAEGQSFFAGTLGALVHDNSLVRPVPHPFDAEPELAAAAESSAK